MTTNSPNPVGGDVQALDYFGSLVNQARARAEKAMTKFPQPNYVLNKVAEESGEVIKAVIHYTEGRETWESVETELIDNLAMLIRLVKEGDQVIGFTPPAEVQRLNATAQPVKLPTTRLWAGKVDCYSKEDVISMLKSLGLEVSE